MVITKILVLGTVALWIAWDIYLVIARKRPTISQWVMAASRRWPIVPFLFGVVMGHLFWGQ